MKKLLVLTELRSHYARMMFSGLLSETRSHGCWEVLRLSQRETNADLIGNLLAQVDGVIARDPSEEILAELHGQELPTVLVRGAQPIEVEPSATLQFAAHVDDAQVGALAVEELQRLNVKHWGFVSLQNVSWAMQRGEALMNHPAKIHATELSNVELEGWAGVLRLAGWLRKVPKPIGVFACSDAVGLMVLQAAQYAGIHVPGEVAVIGVDNDAGLCNSGVPALSSIDLYAGDVGRRAAWQIAHMLGVVNSEPIDINPPMLVARESSHEVDRYFLCFQKALEWLSDHALRGPSVDELAEATGTSRRGLERAFGKHAQMSPATVIRDCRMKHLHQLLVRDKVTLDRIAQQAGFTDVAGLSNFVKRQTGKSPSELRAEHAQSDAR